MKNKITGFTIAEILIAALLIGIITILMLPFLNGSLRYSSWQKSIDYKMGALKYAKILGVLEKSCSLTLSDNISSSVFSPSQFLSGKLNTVLNILNKTGATPNWTAEQMKNMNNPVFTNKAVLADGTWIGEVASSTCSGTYSDSKNAQINNICSTLYIDTNGEKHKSIIGEDVLIMIFLKDCKVLAMSYKNGKLELNTKLGKLYKANKYIVKCPNSDVTVTYTKDSKTGLYTADGSCPKTCIISNYEELKAALTNPKCKGYTLNNDINIPSSQTKPFNIPDGTSFNGDGHKISGFTTTTTNSNLGIGLFASIGCKTQISNLTLDDVDIETNDNNVGALAGKACKDAQIDDITVADSTIIGDDNVGGVIGQQTSSSLAYLKNLFIQSAYAENNYSFKLNNVLIIGKNAKYFIGNNNTSGRRIEPVDLYDASKLPPCNIEKPNKKKAKRSLFAVPTKVLQNKKCTIENGEIIEQNNKKLTCEPRPDNKIVCYEVDDKGNKKSCQSLAPNQNNKIPREETWNGSNYTSYLYPPDAHVEGRCTWPNGKSYIIESVKSHLWFDTIVDVAHVRLRNGELVFGVDLGILINKIQPYTCEAWCKAHSISKNSCRTRYCDPNAKPPQK